MERVAPPIPTISTTRLVLRPLSRGDIDTIVAICAPLEVAQNMLLAPHPYTPADAEAFLGRVDAELAKQGYIWAVTKKSAAGGAGEHIGNIGLHTNWEHHHAETGYTFGVPYWGQGYATEAVKAVLEFGFMQTSLVRIHAGYYTRNPASGRVLEKCGFKPEGVRPRMYLKFGQWIDLALMRLFREEWEAIR